MICNMYIALAFLAFWISIHVLGLILSSQFPFILGWQLVRLNVSNRTFWPSRWDWFYLFLFARRKAGADQHKDAGGQPSPDAKFSSPRSSSPETKPQIWAILDGLWLILSSTYLIYVSLFLWLSAVVSSFFYFQVKGLFFPPDASLLLAIGTCKAYR